MNAPRLFAQEIIEDIIDRIHGRICHESSNCNFLAWAIAQAGDGDHLEIGALHGGSAVLAALVKVVHGHSGDVWCIDPLDGYYKGTPFEFPVDFVSKVPVSLEIFEENLRIFGVADRVHIVQASSIPWPAGLPDHFASAFIDGDHWGEAPLTDWNNVKRRTSRYVVFDNTDNATHPAVVNAVEIARVDPEWECVLQAGITAIFKRRAP
jgi:hypothetical protein